MKQESPVYTVEAETTPGVIDAHNDDAVAAVLEHYPWFLDRYGVHDAAVIVKGDGAIALTGTALTRDEHEAVNACRKGLSWLQFASITAYEGEAQ